MLISPVSDRMLIDAPAFRASGDSTFRQLLRQADFSPPDAPAPAPGSVAPESAERAQTREAAKALIASAFLVPMLASVRDSSFAAGPYAPTAAERRFGPMFDQQIADRVMQGTNFALIDSIVDRIAGPDRRA